MIRILRRIGRNWPLKLGAVGLAIILYAGLVLTQNARTWSGSLPIQVLGQPASSYIVGDVGNVASITYFTTSTSNAGAPEPSAATFAASVDLAGVSVPAGGGLVTLDVHVRAADPAVTIVDFEPRRVIVRLDPTGTRDVAVVVDTGTLPEGLSAGKPVVDVATVSVTGPASIVARVATAQARVQVPASGLTVDEVVDLVAVDSDGAVLSPVRISPSSVRVHVEIGSALVTKSVPVAPVLTGAPASGNELGDVTTSPAAVTIRGSAEALASITSAPTKGISVEGAGATFTRSVELDLPAGVSPVGISSVEVSVGIRPQAGTRSFVAGVVLAGARSDRAYTLSASSVLVTLGGPLARLNAIDAASFTVSIDVSGLDAGRQTLAVRVALPSGVTLVTTSPATITVTISAPQASASPTIAPTAGP